MGLEKLTEKERYSIEFMQSNFKYVIITHIIAALMMAGAATGNFLMARLRNDLSLALIWGSYIAYQ